MLPNGFWSKIEMDPVTGCWKWLGDVDSAHRPVAKIQGRKVTLIRAVWQHYRQRLSPKVWLRHRDECRNKRCLNVDHFRTLLPTPLARA